VRWESWRLHQYQGESFVLQGVTRTQGVLVARQTQPEDRDGTDIATTCVV